MSRDTDERTTPQELFDSLDTIFSFTLDAAATSDNTKCSQYFTKEYNGLIQDWRGHVVWINPPYSRGQLIQWIHKAARSGALVVMVLPGDISTGWFHDLIKIADIAHLCQGRFKFNGNLDSAKFGTVISVFNAGGSAARYAKLLKATVPGYPVMRQMMQGNEPMPSAHDLLAHLEARGFALASADGGKIRISPISKLTDADRDAIATRKPELLVLLAGRAPAHSPGQIALPSDVQKRIDEATAKLKNHFRDCSVEDFDPLTQEAEIERHREKSKPLWEDLHPRVTFNSTGPSRLCAFDFETEKITKGAAKAPRPVGFAIWPAGESPHYFGFGHSDGNNCTFDQARERLREIFANCTVVMHNVTFDLRVALDHFGLVPARFEDTLLQAFLVNPRAMHLGLKELAAKLLSLPANEGAVLHDWIKEHLNVRGGFESHYDQVPVGIITPYACGDVMRTGALHAVLREQVTKLGMDGAYRRELELVPILNEMSARGICIDIGRLERDSKDWQEQIEKLEQSIRCTLNNDGLNLNSGDQLADALEHAHVVDPANWSRTATGKRAVSRAQLQRVVRDPELRAMLGHRSRLQKILSAYARPWLELAGADGRLHPDWNATRRQGDVGARTGRITSTPNLQNVHKKPVEGLPYLRDYIIPDDGLVLLDADFSQQEYRLLGHYGGGALCNAYASNPGFDIHEGTRQAIGSRLGIDIDRDKAKTLNFAIIYGMGDRSLAASLGIPIQDATRFRAAYMEIFDDVRELSAGLSIRARQLKPLRTWGGRVYFPEPSKDYAFLNYLIQSSAADVTKTAMIRAHQLGLELMLTVHDELVAVCDPADCVAAMGKLREAMESVELGIPLPTDAKWSARSWGSLEPWSSESRISK